MNDDPIVSNFNGVPFGYHNPHRGWGETYAQWIRDNPQAHVDALVKAGVLTVASGWANDRGQSGIYYAVVQPHVHDIYVEGVEHAIPRDRPDAFDERLRVKCRGCELVWSVPNRLPTEVTERTGT